jgi:fumarylacetoacetase
VSGYGVFSTTPHGPRRIGVRAGDHVLDLSTVAKGTRYEHVLSGPTLNPLLEAGPEVWSRVAEWTDGPPIPLEDVTLHLPFEVADYVDFYSSRHHAENAGRILRPDAAEPLPPSWRHLPIGYHGRAGTVVVSGTDVVRPHGQVRENAFGPTQKLDFEAEVGFVVGTAAHRPVPVDEFAEHVFGVCLVNDWSARDIQAWEYVPLGPFLGKSFATSISPWIVPLSALDRARREPPPQEPGPLPYLQGAKNYGYDITLEVRLNGHVISRPPFADMYWTPAQQLAHLTVNGASLRTGDLYASGTVSGTRPDQYGSLLELTWGGRDKLSLPDGTARTFLEDGDEVVISATAPGPAGRAVGFGEVRGRIVGHSGH